MADITELLKKAWTEADHDAALGLSMTAADEIEQLREQVQWASDRASEWKLETYQLNAEIEQLRAEIRELKKGDWR